MINSIISEGWDFHIFSTTFVSRRETSLDSGPASRLVTVHGDIVGTSIFTNPACGTSGAGNTAHVLCGNIPTSNATVFVIDKVLTAKTS